MNNDLIYKASRLLNAETFYPQDALVKQCLSRGTFKYEDIINYCYHPSYVARSCNEAIAPIYSWIPTSSFFAYCLIKHNAPVLRNHFGNWWGRSNKGLVLQDPLLLEIVKELEA